MVDVRLEQATPCVALHASRNWFFPSAHWCAFACPCSNSSRSP